MHFWRFWPWLCDILSFNQLLCWLHGNQPTLKRDCNCNSYRLVIITKPISSRDIYQIGYLFSNCTETGVFCNTCIWKFLNCPVIKVKSIICDIFYLTYKYATIGASCCSLIKLKVKHIFSSILHIFKVIPRYNYNKQFGILRVQNPLRIKTLFWERLIWIFVPYNISFYCEILLFLFCFSKLSRLR